jgi:RNA polymerase sigma-70 factor (ECF subfamily)
MYPLVSKIVRSNLPRRSDEEDLIQTVLTRVFRKLDQFSGRVPLRHWVSRIAVNACLNMIRYEKRRPEIRMADLGEDEAKAVQNLATSAEPLDSSLGFAARDLVQQLVGCLRPKERLLVRLVYLEGLTIQAASEATGWSEGAVTMRISRAKARMRARYAYLFKGENP